MHTGNVTFFKVINLGHPVRIKLANNGLLNQLQSMDSLEVFRSSFSYYCFLIFFFTKLNLIVGQDVDFGIPSENENRK